MSVQKFVRPHLHAIRPYVPGKPIAEVRRELGIEGRIVKLASNENPVGTSPLSIEAMKGALEELWLYPEDSVHYLKQALAELHQVPASWIVLGNGAVEVIYLLAQALLGPGDEAIMGRPSFMIYAIMSQMHDARSVQISHPDQRNDLDAFADAITERTKIVWVDNPNNPTGTYEPKAVVDRFIDRVDDRAVVVLDEAYFPFVDDPDRCDAIDYVRAGRDNVVALRTFSKIVGLAGARCGYGVMHPDLARILNSMRIKFSVNSLAQVAALAALRDADHVRNAQELVWSGRRFFYDNLERRGIPFNPTQGNFVWIDLGPDSRAICEALMHRGVIVRPGWVFDQPTRARVSIGSASDNAFFFEQLDAVLG